MITVNLFKDGVYIKGHDIPEICSFVSYAIYALTNDCLTVNDNIRHYFSGNDKKRRNLGFTFLKINQKEEEQVKILSSFKENIKHWVSEVYPQVKVIDSGGTFINYNKALKDAKQEQVSE